MPLSMQGISFNWVGGAMWGEDCSRGTLREVANNFHQVLLKAEEYPRIDDMSLLGAVGRGVITL